MSDVNQILDPDVHMSQPKDSKKQRVPLSRPWWNMEVQSPTKGWNMSGQAKNPFLTHFNSINKQDL